MKKWLAALACSLPVAISACAGGASDRNTSMLPASSGTGERIAATATATPSATPTPVVAPTLPPTVMLEYGRTLGLAGQFSPKRGDTKSGGNGQTVDNVACAPHMTENQFHVHSYIGVLVNGQWDAMPDSIGLNGYGPVINGTVNAAYCFYDIHTHDDSGTIHQEAASTTPNSGSLYTLGNVMDIWGQTLNSTTFANFSGMVRVFTAQAPFRTLYANNYTEYLGDPNQIPLYSHEAIWIEVGPPYVEAAQLPQVRFYTEY